MIQRKVSFKIKTVWKITLIPDPYRFPRKSRIYYGQLRFKDQNDHLSDSFTHFKLIAGLPVRTYFIPCDLLSDFVLFQETVRSFPLVDYPFDQLRLFWSNKSVKNNNASRVIYDSMTHWLSLIILRFPFPAMSISIQELVNDLNLSAIQKCFHTSEWPDFGFWHSDIFSRLKILFCLNTLRYRASPSYIRKVIEICKSEWP